RETPQVCRLLQSIQPIIEPDNTHAQAYRIQALLLWVVRKGIPEEGRPKET
ncbi:hypothetical protein HHI36_004266, partial [Cryptolaemus montrouzieri]